MYLGPCTTRRERRPTPREGTALGELEDDGQEKRDSLKSDEARICRIWTLGIVAAGERRRESVAEEAPGDGQEDQGQRREHMWRPPRT